MSAEQTRAVILQFVKYIIEKDYAGLASLGAPGATYWIAGLQEKVPFAGPGIYQERVENLVPTVFNEMKNIQLTITGLVLDGDTGLVEVHGEADGAGTKEGRVYKNDVAFKFVVNEGKITAVREYVDFFSVFKFLGVEV